MKIMHAKTRHFQTELMLVRRLELGSIDLEPHLENRVEMGEGGPERRWKVMLFVFEDREREREREGGGKWRRK